MPFSASALTEKRHIFFGVDIVVDSKSKCGLSWCVLLSTISTRHNSFPKHIFVLSLHVKRVWESSWNERLTRTSSSVCTFKSESVFSIFNKSFQRFLSLSLILWWKKKQFECRLVWHWWNSTDLGLIDMFLCRNCCLFIITQKIALQAEFRKYFQIWFFPRFGGKNGGVLSMRMQVILDSLFARPSSVL